MENPAEILMDPFDPAPSRDVVPPDLNGLRVVTFGEPGHFYSAGTSDEGLIGQIEFQNGGVAAKGVNGWTNEAVLAVLIDRTKILDAKFPCDENKSAIQSMQAALDVFNKRTAARLQRGVEGKEVA